MLAASVFAGLDRVALAGGLAAATTLLLAEKTRLHAFVARIDGDGFRAGLRFAVLALVVLPLVPEGPFGTWGGGIRPRSLWLLVLVFAGLSFAGYVARIAVSPRYGAAIAGLIGGLVSSTGVTLDVRPGQPRSARGGRAARAGRAGGVHGARAAGAGGGRPPGAGARAAADRDARAGVRRRAERGGDRAAPIVAAASRCRRPAQSAPLGAALQMAAIFQVVLIGLHEMRLRFGGAGLRWSAVLLGLTDVDALTASMARSRARASPSRRRPPRLPSASSRTPCSRWRLPSTIGRGAFRWYVAAGLAAVAAALVATLRATHGL